MKTIRIQKQSTETMEQFQLKISILQQIVSSYNQLGKDALQTLSSSMSNETIFGQEYDGDMGKVLKILSNR